MMGSFSREVWGVYFISKFWPENDPKTTHVDLSPTCAFAGDQRPFFKFGDLRVGGSPLGVGMGPSGFSLAGTLLLTVAEKTWRGGR